MVQLYPLEQELKDIIIRTNKVMNRWKITNSNWKTSIDPSDVKSIFLGYLRKLVSNQLYGYRTFKDIRRLILIKINEDKQISQIFYASSLPSVFDKLDYEKLIKLSSVSDEKENPINLSNLAELGDIRSKLNKLSQTTF